MTVNKQRQAEVKTYISTVLDHHFNETPASINILIQPPFIVVYLTGFLLPTERLLLDRNESERVLKTRDLMMTELKPELMTGLATLTELAIDEFYADWNLENETALFLAVASQGETAAAPKWSEDATQKALLREVIQASKKTQKEPQQTNVYWLDGYAVLIERSGILTEIEKELVQNGEIEALRLAKRPLERRLMKSAELSAILKQDIQEMFVDWNFESDKAYLVLVFEKKKE